MNDSIIVRFRNFLSAALPFLPALLAAISGFNAAHAIEPNFPRAYVNTTMPLFPGPVNHLASGGDLQAALNNATCGSAIALAAGGSFTGNFVLPKKQCTGWIAITTDIPSSSLPPEGTRLTPAKAASSNLAKIITPNAGPAITTEHGAGYYRIIGVQVTELATFPAGYSVNGTPSYLNYGLVTLGDGGETIVEDTPQFIVLDRMYFWARPASHCKRAVALNGRNIAVIDSYIEGMKGVGQDTQAILGWNGAGPFKINNNYLEGAGENVMFGGADSAVPNLSPSDIEMRGNFINKPLSWQTPFTVDSDGNQSQWSVKNSFETKNARRLLFEGNVIENSWAQAQTGFAVVLKPSNNDGTWRLVCKHGYCFPKQYCVERCRRIKYGDFICTARS